MKILIICLKILFVTLFHRLTWGSEYYLGKEKKSWGLKLNPTSNKDLQLRIGGRLQTILERESTIHADNYDFFARRVRFQFEAKLKNDLRYYMDVRNDNANKGDSGEREFNVGDAYVEKGNLFGNPGLKARFFRAKVDVSRSQTVSSSKVLYLVRSSVSDEASNFVSQSRRAMNAQILGDFDYFSYQLVIGDGIQKGDFNDAKGNSLSSGSIDRQNLMVGGKLLLYPIFSLKPYKRTETYLGVGKHFSLGAGIFNTSQIEYSNSGQTQVASVDRTLLNGELSFHFGGFSFQTEYFHFDGVVEDFSASTQNLGTSTGYYAQAEYVLTDFYYLAPFVRYESWDRFSEKSGFVQTGQVYGINWYLKGNDIRLGLAFDTKDYGNALTQTDSRGRTFQKIDNLRLTTMWHF